jgi:phospholipase C
MTTPDRRSILRALGATALATALPETISRALAIPANRATGTIQDVEHIVVLMQENRSFDHYFGTLRGVRGFNDPRAVTLSTGKSAFYQPTASGNGYVLPFHPPGAGVGLQFLPDLAHGWSDAHGAWNNGNNDKWIKNKGTATMAYLKRSDIPFHYALADAFTICDAYHCATMTSTDPNRYYLWSGWVGQNGTAPDGLNDSTSGSTPGVVALNNSGSSEGNGPLPYGPVVNNDEQGYSWTTYPEHLQNAGISWKIYQDIGVGLTADGSWGWTNNPYIGNYGDTSTLYFLQYQNAVPGNPLYDLSRTGTNIYNGGAYNGGTLFDVLRGDVLNNQLPQVSWIVAPEAYCEHPNWPANYGAWYIANVLSALTANPTVWSKTVLIYCFDENDGFFDHVVAPTAPQSAAYGQSTVSTVNEIYPGVTGRNASSYPPGPYGLGARVPLIIISPWSKGGWVCSQVFDHTSVIRFIEKRFGVVEPNITPWRRVVCGDLTAAFDFSIADPLAAHLPGTSSYAPPFSDIVSAKRYPSVALTPPANQTLPVQEAGQRLARALPYQLQADGQADQQKQTFAISFTNTGAAGAWFHVRTANGASAGGSTGPWGYTVEAGKSLSDIWTPASNGAYDLSVHGPNGFFRRFAGGVGASAANLTVATSYDLAQGGITLTVTNAGTASTLVTIVDKYTGNSRQQVVAPGVAFETYWSLHGSYSWYDLVITAGSDSSFSRHYAGHVETGADGVSDPLL